MNEAKLGWGGARKGAGAKPAGYVPPPERIEYEAERARNENAKSDQYVIYESSSELRDSESISLNQGIYDYFLAEVRPHVSEAWLDMESIKIGYEISFNKYFYQHRPLRNLDEVANELLQLDKEADGLIRDILGG